MTKKEPVRVYTQKQVQFIAVNLIHRLDVDKVIETHFDFTSDLSIDTTCEMVDALIAELKQAGHMEDIEILPYGSMQ